MLSNLFTFVKAKGSSLSLPAHGWVGARATSFLAAHFAKQNTNSVGVQSEGEAEGGCGGNSASPEPKRSPAALLVKSRPQKKSFVFLLKEKIGRAQIKNCEQNFSLSERALASGGGAERQNSAFGFSLKKVRISFSVRSLQKDIQSLDILFFCNFMEWIRTDGKGRKREFSHAEESPRKPEGFRESPEGTIGMQSDPGSAEKYG